jgi:hypothetical protein
MQELLVVSSHAPPMVSDREEEHQLCMCIIGLLWRRVWNKRRLLSGILVYVGHSNNNGEAILCNTFSFLLMVWTI